MQLKVGQVDDLHHGDVGNPQLNFLVWLEAFQGDDVLGCQILVDHLALVKVAELLHDLVCYLTKLCLRENTANICQHV